MAQITLNSKEYDLHFKNRELKRLEEQTGLGMKEFFEQLDGGKITPMYTLLLVMLKRHDDFKHMTEDGFMDVLDDEMDKDLTFDMLGDVLKEVVEDSVFMKQQRAELQKAKLEKVAK